MKMVSSTLLDTDNDYHAEEPATLPFNLKLVSYTRAAHPETLTFTSADLTQTDTL